MAFGLGPELDNLFGVLLLLLVAGVVYRLVAPRFKRGAEVRPIGTAELIARERFARGEITEAEFHQIVRALAAR